MRKQFLHIKQLSWLILFLILLAAFLTWWFFTGRIHEIDRKIEEHNHARQL